MDLGSITVFLEGCPERPAQAALSAHWRVCVDSVRRALGVEDIEGIYDEIDLCPVVTCKGLHAGGRYTVRPSLACSLMRHLTDTAVPCPAWGLVERGRDAVRDLEDAIEEYQDDGGGPLPTQAEALELLKGDEESLSVSASTNPSVQLPKPKTAAEYRARQEAEAEAKRVAEEARAKAAAEAEMVAERTASEKMITMKHGTKEMLGALTVLRNVTGAAALPPAAIERHAKRALRVLCSRSVSAPHALVADGGLRAGLALVDGKVDGLLRDAPDAVLQAVLLVCNLAAARDAALRAALRDAKAFELLVEKLERHATEEVEIARYGMMACYAHVHLNPAGLEQACAAGVHGAARRLLGSHREAPKVLNMVVWVMVAMATEDPAVARTVVADFRAERHKLARELRQLHVYYAGVHQHLAEGLRTLVELVEGSGAEDEGGGGERHSHK